MKKGAGMVRVSAVFIIAATIVLFTAAGSPAQYQYGEGPEMISWIIFRQQSLDMQRQLIEIQRQQLILQGQQVDMQRQQLEIQRQQLEMDLEKQRNDRQRRQPEEERVPPKTGQE